VDLTAILARLDKLEADAKKPVKIGVRHPDGTETTHESFPDEKYKARVGIDLSRLFVPQK
jgi:uncharacterized protein YfaS (alpha-2-macroglobulin family)